MSQLISIIVPCHNVEKYIDTCLNSIVNQTFSNIEIICIEDHSVDQTLEKLNNWKSKDQRIKVYRLNQLYGAANARNFGLKIAKGDYITFIDSDDFVAINFLEDFYRTSEKTKIPIISDIHHHMRANQYNNMELFLSAKDSIYIANFKQDPSNILKFAPFITGKLYKREAIQTKFLPNHIWEDLPFFVETSLHNSTTIYVNFIDSNNYYYYYRQNKYWVSQSLSTPSAKNLDIIAALQHLLIKTQNYCKQNERCKKVIDTFIANFLFESLKIIFYSYELSREEQEFYTILLRRIYQFYFPDFINQISKISNYDNFKIYDFLCSSICPKVNDIKKEEKDFIKAAKKRKKKIESSY